MLVKHVEERFAATGSFGDQQRATESYLDRFLRHVTGLLRDDQPRRLAACWPVLRHFA